jgi:hypothetical protein
MNRAELEHAIRAACDVAGDDEVYVFGSQSILGEHPNPPELLRASVEVDIQPKNRTEAIDLIDGALGEDSLFHRTHGFYVHGVSIDSAELPSGWKGRTVIVCDPKWTRGKTGHCLESHDLAASKLAAYREKDLVFVATLLTEGLIEVSILAERVRTLPLDEEVRARLLKWVDAMARSLERAEAE